MGTVGSGRPNFGGPNMLRALLLLGICLLVVEGQRRGFRPRGGRRRGGGRRGRQEVGAGYAAPSDSYSAGDVPVYGQPEYGASDAVPTYAAGDDALAALGNSIPGVPGSGFSCEGQVDGGYYADPKAECQAFHICTA